MLRFVPLRAAKTQSSSVLTSFVSTRSWQHRSIFSLFLLEERPGFIRFQVRGKKAFVFKNEAGGIRFQRCPPTEKRGRVQTSTITIAILENVKEEELTLSSSDLQESFTRGSGAGGQHRNKTSTAVILTHKPSGIKIRAEDNKSQGRNRESARERLKQKLSKEKRKRSKKKEDRIRREQVGSGMRGDKFRTCRVQHDQVVDHRTGKKTTWKRYSRGFVSDLW